MDQATSKMREVSPYTIELSSNLDGQSLLSPMETTLARVEPHGAVAFFRFVSGEETAYFELTGAEVDALVGTLRRRKAIMRRYHAARSGDIPNDETCIPF